ncbi:MAG: hypothetical protein M8840_08795 [marine benthic group bacterium]|nr:hypothetical protein [Gemmatimonadota bacterium]MCL7965959.1 hypothetical protein [Gemmatimonadota bacterium]MCL7969262.1 hypothetical protein [Gemmatimonadota bacterium]MCL7991225.1 hypothetical protein [Gemmatimonadota bacterium]
MTGLLVGDVGASGAQEIDVQPPAPTIDRVEITTENVFSEEEVRDNFIFRLLNKIRFDTSPRVVQKELLFGPGSTLDSTQLAETERNLRRLGIFRSVDVDTATRRDSLIAEVTTRDSWSTQPIFSFSFSGGTLTGRIGLSEKNLFGSGNRARVAYRKGVDRNALELDALFRRLFGSQIDVAGLYFGLSDGDIGQWYVGDPWRSAEDHREIGFGGDYSNRRIPQYRVFSAAQADTTFYRYRGFGQGLSLGVATVARSGRYVRLGVEGAVRNDRYLFEADTASVLAPPDSVKGWIGGFVESRSDRFEVFQYLNGFSREDVNLSPYVSAGIRIAPSGFGYDRDGIGLAGSVGTGARTGPVFLRLDLRANALFTSVGVDSGRVVLNLSAAAKPARKQAILVGAFGGILENPPPGSEFDLGFDRAPRSYDPHSFVGTRAVSGTVEYRWYVWDSLLGLFGLGFAGFVDYAGAWYPDQDARWGGNVGLGLRTGSARGSGASTGRIDFGYRFGPDAADSDGGRWALSLGTGFSFF